MPFGLTLSPHLDGARSRVIDWTHSMGFLQEGVWDEDKLIAADLPLCAAGRPWSRICLLGRRGSVSETLRRSLQTT